MILYLSSSKFGNRVEMLKEWIKNQCICFKASYEIKWI